MPNLKKEQFEKLANFNTKPSISIYMPTTRAGKDVLEEKDRIQLKDQWKKVYERLKAMNLSQDKIDKIGKPVEDLLADTSFWRHQSDGLALFVAEDYSQHYCVPVDFEPFIYIDDHFYLKPLVPMFNGTGAYYLLSLQMDQVKLYECSKYSISEIDIDELVPAQLEDRVGYDFEARKQKHQTQNGRQGSTVVSGDDAAERARKNEFLRFFRAVDKGLHEILKDQKIPLVVACQDYLFPIYKDANTYNHLYPEVVSGNPSDYRNNQALHEASLEVLEPYFNKQKTEKMEQFNELNPERRSIEVKEIIPAVFEGKVDTLFLQKEEEIWGNYNENMASVEVNDEKESRNISLMNLAAVKVLEQNGNVYLIEDEFMPIKNTRINAIYRY